MTTAVTISAQIDARLLAAFSDELVRGAISPENHADFVGRAWARIRARGEAYVELVREAQMDVAAESARAFVSTHEPSRVDAGFAGLQLLEGAGVPAALWEPILAHLRARQAALEAAR